MRWEKVGLRDLRLVEMTQEERERIETTLNQWCDPSVGLAEAKTMASHLREDALRRRYLTNQRLNRNETLTQFSAWCDASGRYAKGKPYAQRICRMLFAGQVIPRVITADGQPVPNAAGLLDTFITKVLSAQESPAPLDPAETEIVSTPEGRTEGPLPPTSISLEKDLRDHIAYNPSIIEPGLKLRGKEYSIDMGRIDVLCEDANGKLVVIELKKDRSSEEVVGQILKYMGCLHRTENRDVRGIVVVGGRDDRLVDAVSPVPSIKLMYYRVQFVITEEPPTDDDRSEV